MLRRAAREIRSVLASSPAVAWATEFVSLAALTPSGRRVSRSNSLQMIAVLACQGLISDGVAMLPLEHYRTVGGINEVSTGARVPAWIRQPNPFQTPFEFWQRAVLSALADGNIFLYTARDPNTGAVTALYCLHPEAVSIVEGPLGDNRYLVSSDGLSDTFDRSQILHIPAFVKPGESRGLSPLDVAREAIGLGLTAEEYGARFFGQGTTLAGVIEHPGTPKADEARLLQSMFRKTHAGVKNSHSVGVLTGGASFRPITATPEEAQFLETRRFQKAEIALLYRVPAYLVDSQVTSTWGSGIEEQNKFFVDHTLMPWIRRIEQAISIFLLPRGQYAKFNVDARLRAKTKERYESYALGLSNGFINADEVRALEDMPPLPDGLGQRYYRPLNLGIVGADEAPPAAAVDPAPAVVDEEPADEVEKDPGDEGNNGT